MANPDAPRNAAWWADSWANAAWVNAAKNSIIIGFFATLLATALGTIAALGLSRPEMPFRRLIMAVLIHARREFTYEIDAASLMLVSEQWIPVEGAHELPLIDGLIAQKRRFLKPLRYDAKAAAAFPNALLLDCGTTPVPLYLTSEFMSPKDRTLMEKAIDADGKSNIWYWHTAHPIPPLPLQTSGQHL